MNSFIYEKLYQYPQRQLPGSLKIACLQPALSIYWHTRRQEAWAADEQTKWGEGRVCIFPVFCWVFCPFFNVEIPPPRHLHASPLLSGSLSAHKEVFHDSTHFIFFSQHMDGTITPYNLFSRQPGHFADLRSTYCTVASPSYSPSPAPLHPPPKPITSYHQGGGRSSISYSSTQVPLLL